MNIVGKLYEECKAHGTEERSFWTTLCLDGQTLMDMNSKVDPVLVRLTLPCPYPLQSGWFSPFSQWQRLLLILPGLQLAWVEFQAKHKAEERVAYTVKMTQIGMADSSVEAYLLHVANPAPPPPPPPSAAPTPTHPMFKGLQPKQGEFRCHGFHDSIP